MKLLIDIDEDVRIAISRMGLLRIPDEMQKKVDKAIQHGTPIPDNATNGEVIKAMFPNIEVADGGQLDMNVYGLVRRPSIFSKIWWNAPYQKGGKEE